MNNALAASIDHIRYDVSLAPMRIPSSAKTAPASGCISTNIGHSFAACASTAGSPVNARGSQYDSGARTSANTAPSDDRPADHPHGRVVGGVRLAGAERPPDDHLAGDRDRVEEQREEDEQLVRDLVRAELGIAHAREHRRRDEERRVERRRPHEDLPADAHHRPHLRQARPPRRRVRAQQLDDERDPHRRLRDRRARRPSRRSPSGSRRRTAPPARGSRRSRGRRSRAGAAGSPRLAGTPGPPARSAPRAGRTRRCGSRRARRDRTRRDRRARAAAARRRPRGRRAGRRRSPARPTGPAPPAGPLDRPRRRRTHAPQPPSSRTSGS